MRLITSLVVALALTAPTVALAEEPAEFDVGRAVAEMPMPSLERHLKAQAAAARIVRRTARAMGLADKQVRRAEILLAQNQPR